MNLAVAFSILSTLLILSILFTVPKTKPATRGTFGLPVRLLSTKCKRELAIAWVSRVIRFQR
ncbi:MAG: hypothetical protein QOH25_1685 [Acidobacteriota bacterium]|nr:hypothetical protein [Acidobacteriota bacterium]